MFIAFFSFFVALAMTHRFLLDSLYSSYKFFKASSRCGTNSLMLICEFSTKL
ncbi:hypothetical protein Goshw_020303 [Gossypium schwendimanii]|uniref:Uncharacterized protein n=1 Tax=Gossypium schwendimanii TaxID=34291 RepID=A0A7J9LPV6_GOSSC|nr:hypothetical protein [Gossypium schwendimanii]